MSDLEALYPEVLYLEPGGCLGLGVTTAGSPQVSVASLQSLIFKGLGQLLHEICLRPGEMAVIGRFYRSPGVSEEVRTPGGRCLFENI